MATVYFDIGATLADVSAAPDGSLTFRPRPRVHEVLDALAGTELGIISNPGPGERARAHAAAALGAAFPGRFTDGALIRWGPKDSRAIFDDAVAAAGADAEDCVFVGEDPDERAFAREAGLRTAPHPVFAAAVIEGRQVLWIRISLPEDKSLTDLGVVANAAEVVPVHVASARLVLAMAAASGVEHLVDAGFAVDQQASVDDTVAFLVRDDRAVEPPSGIPGAPAPAAAPAGGPADGQARAAAAFSFMAGGLTGLTQAMVSLGPAPGGVYIAAPAGTPLEELHIPGARHGHTERLLPDPGLLARPGELDAGALAAGFPRTGFAAAGPSPETVDAVRAAVTSSKIRGHTARLSGAAPLVDGDPRVVTSRDVSNPGNTVVVDALAAHFHRLGFAVTLQPFTWRGHRLANVEAEHRVDGSGGAVLVTAHLDSTAAYGEFADPAGRPRPYDPGTDPAPGADDDGSGTAAVLAAAECLSAMVAAGRTPARTVRFVLFNAEEQGLIGSKYYARAAAANGDTIAAVLQMDMIAGLQDGARRVEIHAGTAMPGPVADASNALGDRLAEAAAAIEPGLEVQRLTGSADPAAGRSDHASFHERGWAAVAVSENFFADTSPATGTRQYHLPGDTLEDADHNTEYAAAIARAVTVAALTLAGL
ncbi:M28 family metallopeptidase [Arthrobacter sp. HS15c]|uniref:M28 family metallopeptidase n=1 Tax=Arthrobacter sp. HS15c TaxID=3230279 RepID=UPI003466DA21